MSLLSALHTLVIGPLQVFFEIIFSLANRVVHHPGLSIIVLSLAMNFLVLPLYRRADRLQEEERETEARLGHWVKHIKKTFKGDERFMMLQTYYRQNDYKPSYVLRGSVSLLLEIPFFMAAYHFLSTLPILEGVSFGPIRDLGAPDAMFVVAGFTVNVLPILMTGINLLSSAIYTRGLPLRSKVQLYVMAALFLILLYDSPSGLVFYWTLNNVFSLIKNVFYKLKNPGKVLSWISSLAGVGILIYGVLQLTSLGARMAILLCLLGLALQLPLVSRLLRDRLPEREGGLSPETGRVFRLGCVLLTVLTGLLIPSAVIHSSPEEFINIFTLTSPVWYVVRSALLAAGTFLIWFGVFYALAENSGKRTMSLLVWLLAGGALIDYFFFGKSYGTLNPSLVYVTPPVFPRRAQLMNLLALAAAAAVLLLIWVKRRKLAGFAAGLVSAAMLVMSVTNVAGIHAVAADRLVQLQQQEAQRLSFPLSRTEQNVVVIMLDRAIGSYVPYLLQEKPQLREQLAGFTYYPNTISFGGSTNFGAPALFGGYEYTPAEMDKRDDELLVDKHNEAMRVMPVLFDRAGFDVTVCNPTYAGYQWIPDLSIYDDYPDIRAFNADASALVDPDETQASGASFDAKLNRNFYYHSLFRTLPVFLQPLLYENGAYCQRIVQSGIHGEEGLRYESVSTQTMDGLTRASGLLGTFMPHFEVLQAMGDLTEVKEKTSGSFIMMSNDTTHEPMLLQEPDYLPAYTVDNTEYDAVHTDRFVVNGRRLKMETEQQVIHYHANMAAFLQLGRWFDELRAEGVYDNTRIILVSDHGRGLNQYDDHIWVPGIQEDLMFYNPLLMVKDFNSTEFTTDHTFMTNADTPTLAMAGLIDAPVNPFTHKPVSSEPKLAGPQLISISYLFNVNENNGYTFIPDGWISVHDDIFEADNWKLIHPNINSR